MDCNYQVPSLLPYLRGEEDITLDFSSVISEAVPSLPGHRSNVPRNFGDTLSVSYQSRLLDGTGCPVKNVTLLLQRDEYSQLQNHPRITNTDIDRCWQSALTARAPADSDNRGFIFRNQIDQDGKLRPFASLFYCQKKDNYFHPPCSRCGKMLQLCLDDNLLEEFGLAHYTTSSDRYLYCPNCTPLHGKPWYTKERKRKDNAAVADLADLLESFGAISAAVDEDLGFACFNCDCHDKCFGHTNDIMPVAAISFYPFNMLITAERNLSGAEFLAMVAGAPAQKPTEQEKGYENNRFFTKEDGRHFLEIIFLKLLFLRKIAEISERYSLFASRNDSPLLLSNISVCCKPRSILPRLWNFSLSAAGIDNFLHNTPEPSTKTPANCLFNFGLFWFTVFLTNSRQDESAVVNNLLQLLQEKATDQSAQPPENDFFHSRNNYWHPVKKKDNSNHLALWNEILECGWNFLINASKQEQADHAQIIAATDSLLIESKKLMLSPPTPADTGNLQYPKNSDIYQTLLRIADKWQGSVVPGPIPAAAAVKESEPVINEQDPDATIIIRDRVPLPDPSHNQQETVILTPPDTAPQQQSSATTANTALEETFIIQTGSRQKISVADIVKPAPCKEKKHHTVSADLEETVRIGVSDDMPGSPGRPVEQRSSDLLEETVVIRGTDTTSDISDNASNPVIDKTETMTEGVDFLTETVVLKPTKKDN